MSRKSQLSAATAAALVPCPTPFRRVYFINGIKVGGMARMIVTIFRSRLRAEHEREYHEWSARMESLARAMPGFASIKTFYAPDGERVSIVEFETAEAHEAWRNHPEHIEAQRLGRERFYSEFKIQVLENPREYSFK